MVLRGLAGRGLDRPRPAGAGREQTFTGFHYLPVTGGFSLRLDYEGHTEVTGTFRTPPLVIEVGGNDPYDVLSRHRAMLEQRDLVPRRPAGPGQDWWQGPIFCGWGAQCTIAERTGGRLHSWPPS